MSLFSVRYKQAPQLRIDALVRAPGKAVIHRLAHHALDDVLHGASSPFLCEVRGFPLHVNKPAKQGVAQIQLVLTGQSFKLTADALTSGTENVRRKLIAFGTDEVAYCSSELRLLVLQCFARAIAGEVANHALQAVYEGAISQLRTLFTGTRAQESTQSSRANLVVLLPLGHCVATQRRRAGKKIQHAAHDRFRLVHKRCSWLIDHNGIVVPPHQLRAWSARRYNDRIVVPRIGHCDGETGVSCTKTAQPVLL